MAGWIYRRLANLQRDALSNGLAHDCRRKSRLQRELLVELAGHRNGADQNGSDVRQNGNPSIFGHTNATDSFADELPGHTGTRAAVRLAPFFNADLTLQKTFKLPKEGQRIRFRAEAFNAFNTVNFTNPSLALTAPLTFGEFQQTTPPREMQFALRYEF